VDLPGICCPRLAAAGWDDDPFSFPNRRRSPMADRPSGTQGHAQEAARRLHLRYRRDFEVAVVEASLVQAAGDGCSRRRTTRILTEGRLCDQRQEAS